jgi:two-component system NtrC family sensor kinase
MRIGLPGTLSARIIAGYAVLIIAFGAIAVTAVLTAEQLEQSIRVIRLGYLELAFRTRDLADRQQGLGDYLKQDLTEETSARRVTTQVRRLRDTRARVLDDIEEALEAVGRLPEGFRRSLNDTRAEVSQVRALIAANDPLYVDLIAAPPIARPRETTAVDPKLQAAAVAAHRRLMRNETRIGQATLILQKKQASAVETTSKNLEEGAGRMRVLTIWWGVTALVLGVLMTAWATVNLRPLGRLRDAARRIAAGDYGERIDVRGPREVADLAHEFNTMGEQIQARERELVRTERLATVGKMAAVVTHEVRNPLSSIGLNTELLDEELAALPAEDVAEARELCRAVQGEVDRLTAITEEYLHFARLPQPRLVPEALSPIVASLAAFEREPLARRGIELSLDLDAALPQVLVDEGQLRQALRNLLRNAGEAMGGRVGRILVSTRRGEGETIEIRVEDDGPGIPAEVRGRLFDAFVTTKEGGTGLGLALTHQIIREHGGSIRVDSPGRGAVFVVVLPVLPPGASGLGLSGPIPLSTAAAISDGVV